jgi:outer membrane lipoprotein SlyB
VTYGRVTAVQLVTTESANARAAGTIVGGGIGLLAGRNESGSTQALAGVGGALAGRQVGRMASRRQAFEYTILLGGTTTVNMITDEGGFRIGDCVAVERGTFNNRVLPMTPAARECAGAAGRDPGIQRLHRSQGHAASRGNGRGVRSCGAQSSAVVPGLIMFSRTHRAGCAVAAAALLGWGCASQPAKQQTTITYGRVTAVSLVMVDNQRAQATEAVLGASSASPRAQAIRGTGRGGWRAGRPADRQGGGRSQAFSTILLGTTTTMITDEGGFRIGDCVAVERGKFNNMRLADDAQCAPGGQPTTADVEEADACIAAKDKLLIAESDEEFGRAERAVRLHCGDWSDDTLFF